jgi:elongation factor G
MYGKKVVPLTIPIGNQESFSGIVDLLNGKAYTGDKGTAADAPADMAGQIATYRENIVEAVAETDDDLITKYLEGEELTEDELHRGLHQGTMKGDIVPVLATSGFKGIGVSRLLNAIVDCIPSPAEAKVAANDGDVELTPDPNGPLAALVFKTTADPYVGKLSYFRVYSGTLHSDSQVFNQTAQSQERVGQLHFVRGKHQEVTPEIAAGDIGTVTKLAHTGTNDTLSSREKPLVLEPIVLPEPAFTAAVAPKTKGDIDKLGQALQRIVEEDHTLRVGRDPNTGETILSGLGESHVEVAAEKMKRKFGVDVELSPPRVPYRETITTKIQREYVHKKQTGGHGQYARVALELEPLPRGTGFEFVDKVVGGVVPRQYIPAVEKGAHEAMQEGVLAHFPMIDVRVTLFDGKDHPVDSSEMAFKLAGSQALKQGAQAAHPVLLEPVVTMKVRVPDQYTGDVMGDLNSKRARVLGMTPDGGSTVVEAQAPLAEVQRYATDLRSLTQGRGTFHMEFSHYEEAPQHVAQKVIEHAQKEAAAKD